MDSRLRVLIVDDSETDTLLIARLLSKADYEVAYERVQTADAMLAELSRETWDIIIADYTMPSFSGPEALRILQETGMDIPFLLVSGTVAECIAVEMMQAGAQDFIFKDDLARLVPAITRELRQAEIRSEHKHAEKALKVEQDHKLEFYRRMIQAATNGKLVITERAEIEQIAGPVMATWRIRNPEDIKTVRHGVEEMAQFAGMDEERIGLLLVAVGEAATNAFKHAGQGEASLHKMEDMLIVVVSDHGPGIPALALPDVALRPGYSTAGTLGMGYKMMIAIADKVCLATGTEGTTVAIEMMLHPAEPASIGGLLQPLDSA